MAYVRWLGHSAFEVYIDGYRILIDPWLSNPMSPVSVGDYRGNVDMIIVTHDHGDHMGEAIELLRLNPKAVFAAVYEVANFVSEKVGPSERIVGANIGGPLKLPGIDLKVMFFPATHSCSLGTPTSVLIMGKEGSVYHAGDTGLAAEMALVGELYEVDVALLPIGGHFTMDAYQAAKAAEMLRAKVAIPMHYNTFPVIRADPEEFRREVEKRGIPTKVVVLRPGEKYEFGKA
jgi:L-ascorbate metabolism protein UlaG (beta-lactamase superfamily)